MSAQAKRDAAFFFVVLGAYRRPKTVQRARSTVNQEGTGGTEMTGRIAKHLNPFDWHRLKRTNTPVSEGLDPAHVIAVFAVGAKFTLPSLPTLASLPRRWFFQNSVR